MSDYCNTCHSLCCHKCEEHKEHEIVPVLEKVKVFHPPEVESRLNEIRERIEECDTLIEEVGNNMTSVVEKISEMANNAISQLSTIAGERIRDIRSRQSELIRQYNDTELFASVSDYQNPADLIYDAPAVNQFILPELLPVPPSNPPIGVKGSIELEFSLFTKIAVEEEEEEEEEEEDISDDKEDEKVLEDEEIPDEDPVVFRKLSELQEKKKKDLDFVPFETSKIVKPDFLFALPVNNVRPVLLYATWRDGRRIETLYKLVGKTEVTVLVAKKGRHVFGGFSGMKLSNREDNEDGPTFLFSVDKDCYIPYLENGCKLYNTPQALAFGKYDLCFIDDFQYCRSTIENAYGVGIQHGSEEAKSFLAGSSTFRPDEIEVWGFRKVTASDGNDPLHD